MNTNNKPLSRILAIVLSVTVFVAAIVVPASASTYAERWTNVLDYSTVNNSGSNYFAVKHDGFFALDLTGNTIVTDIDIVFRSSRLVSGVTLELNANTKFNLTLESIGSNIYRAYGSAGSYGFEDLVFRVKLSDTSQTSYCQLLQCRISSQSVDLYNIGATITKGPDVSGSSSHPAGGTSHFAFTSAGDWFVTYNFTDWKKFDYLNFSFISKGVVIGSVSAKIGSRIVPVNITSYDGDTGVDYEKLYNGYLDLYGIDHDQSNSLELFINGTCSNTAGAQLMVGFINGTIKAESPSMFALIWNSIEHWFSYTFELIRTFWNDVMDGIGVIVDRLDEFINGSADQQQAAEDFKQSAGEQSSAISGAVDAMDVNRPDVNTDVSVSGITGGLNLGYFNAAMLTVTSSGTVYQILIMTAALMLVSYVLFGKKI